MAIKKTGLADFLANASRHIVIDVRSPGEYNHAHIPSAHNIPLFSNEERGIVGTIYKKEGKQKAIKAGLDFFGVKMKSMVEAVEKISKNYSSNIILVHCWRGGMRSSAFAWLLDLYGYEVHTLEGGYKSFRNWVLAQFEKPYQVKVLGGYTGSGKTELLHAFIEKNIPVVDLEDLAMHKGSAFGGIGQPGQPTQEMFENKLALALFSKSKSTFWIEDESQRIGNLHIPHALWKTIRNSPLYFIDIPFHERHQYILKHYAQLDVEKLIHAVLRIQKRLGPNETKITVGLLLEKNISAAFEILLQYYDKEYRKSLEKRENLQSLLHTIEFDLIDAGLNAEKFISNIN